MQCGGGQPPRCNNVNCATLSMPLTLVTTAPGGAVMETVPADAPDAELNAWMPSELCGVSWEERARCRFRSRQEIIRAFDEISKDFVELRILVFFN